MVPKALWLHHKTLSNDWRLLKVEGDLVISFLNFIVDILLGLHLCPVFGCESSTSYLGLNQLLPSCVKFAHYLCDFLPQWIWVWTVVCLCQPHDRLVIYPGCTRPLIQWHLGLVPGPHDHMKAGKVVKIMDGWMNGDLLFLMQLVPTWKSSGELCLLLYSSLFYINKSQENTNKDV